MTPPQRPDGGNAAYTQGPIARTMLRTGFAMLAGTLAMSGYNLADAWFIGRLPGAIPLAAMGYTLPVVMLLGCVLRGFASGLMTVAAHAIGAGKLAKTRQLVCSGLLLVVLVSLLLMLLGIFAADRVLGLFGASGEALSLARAYMRIWFFGILTASLSMTGNDMLVTVGDARMASAAMILGMAVNIPLDALFIFGLGPVPAMGIRGAALATVLSQGVGTCFVLFLLHRRHGLLDFRSIVPSRIPAAWRAIVRYAVPAILGMLLMPVGGAILTRITAAFGDAAVAATAAVGRLEHFAFVFPMALGMSLTPMVSQNFGARRFDRIHDCRRFSMRFALAFLGAMSVLYFLLAPALARAFTTDAEVARIMALGLRVVPWGFAAVEIHRYASFFFTGCARPAAAAWLNALRIAGLLLPFSFLALAFRSLPGLFFARLAADLAAGTAGWYLAHRFTTRLR
jgi:putative MATE family efflux protein